MLVGIIGSFGQGGLALYGTGLDFSSLIPYLRRVAATIVLSSVGVGFIFLGTLVWNVIDSVAAFVLILLVFTAPWVVINILGYWRRRGFMSPDDLQVFNRGERGGIYWFTWGLNLRAVAAWAIGSAIGMLFVNTTLYIGPYANAAEGVDLSFISASVISGVLYWLFLLVFPEPAEVYGSEAAPVDTGVVIGPGETPPA
jgi:purine-cytosine permease-like protein